MTSRGGIVPAAPFLLFLAIEVARALLGALVVALRGLAVAQKHPEQHGREQKRPDDGENSPATSACVHAFRSLAWPQMRAPRLAMPFFALYSSRWPVSVPGSSLFP